jgi:predicted membrane protein
MITIYFAVGFFWMLFCVMIAWKLSNLYSRRIGMVFGIVLNWLFWPISMIIALFKIRWTIEEIKMAKKIKIAKEWKREYDGSQREYDS